jgi:imidazoleglycerol phosphate dehydratase HisB
MSVVVRKTRETKIRLQVEIGTGKIADYDRGI